MTLRFLVAAALALVTYAAVAQADYPVRPVTIVFPYTPGAAGDTEVRELTIHLQKTLGQPFVMDYRPGASGTIATQQVMRAAPDGYTLLVGTTTTLLTGPLAMPEKVQYGTAVEPISALIRGFSTLDVSASSRYKTLADLAADIKARPGKVNYGSVGPASLSHLVAELFLREIGGGVATHVPYKGPAQAQIGLMAGEIDFLIESAPTALPQIKAGKLRALGVASQQRAPLLPDVSTLSELGVPITSGLWYGIFAPKGTSRSIIERLSQAINEHFRSEQTASTLRGRGLYSIAGSPQQLSDLISEDGPRWTGIIKSINLQ